ncbi:MAG: ferredoxin [Anaerolineae bacterium]
MKVTINRDECIACGACWSDCDAVFEENPDDGNSQIVAKFQVGGNPAEGEIPDDLVDCAKAAADGCPVEIIQVG